MVSMNWFGFSQMHNAYLSRDSHATALNSVYKVSSEMVSSNEQSLRPVDNKAWHNEERGKGSLLNCNLDNK